MMLFKHQKRNFLVSFNSTFGKFFRLKTQFNGNLDLEETKFPKPLRNTNCDFFANMQVIVKHKFATNRIQLFR